MLGICRTNLAIILGMFQVAKRIPFDDPNVLNICRAIYVISNLFIVGMYWYIGSKIDGKKGMPASPPLSGSRNLKV